MPAVLMGLGTALAVRFPAWKLNTGSGLIAGIIAIVFGVLILLVPRLLNYLVAIYLIVVGVLTIWGGH